MLGDSLGCQVWWVQEKERLWRERGEKRREIPTAWGHHGLTQDPQDALDQMGSMLSTGSSSPVLSTGHPPPPHARHHTQLGSSFRLPFLSSSSMPAPRFTTSCNPSPMCRPVCWWVWGLSPLYMQGDVPGPVQGAPLSGGDRGSQASLGCFQEGGEGGTAICRCLWAGRMAAHFHAGSGPMWEGGLMPPSWLVLYWQRFPSTPLPGLGETRAGKTSTENPGKITASWRTTWPPPPSHCGCGRRPSRLLDGARSCRRGVSMRQPRLTDAEANSGLCWCDLSWRTTGMSPVTFTSRFPTESHQMDERRSPVGVCKVCPREEGWSETELGFGFLPLMRRMSGSPASGDYCKLSIKATFHYTRSTSDALPSVTSWSREGSGSGSGSVAGQLKYLWHGHPPGHWIRDRLAPCLPSPVLWRLSTFSC